MYRLWYVYLVYRLWCVYLVSRLWCVYLVYYVCDTLDVLVFVSLCDVMLTHIFICVGSSLCPRCKWPCYQEIIGYRFISNCCFNEAYFCRKCHVSCNASYRLLIGISYIWIINFSLVFKIKLVLLSVITNSIYFNYHVG